MRKLMLVALLFLATACRPVYQVEYRVMGPDHPIEITYQIDGKTTTVTATPPWSVGFRTDGDHEPLLLKVEAKQACTLGLEIRLDDERLWATPVSEQKSLMLEGTIYKFKHPAEL